MNNSTILVVEDEALVAADIELRLQNLGYSVAAIVDTAEDAIAAAGNYKPDLALMDIRLRGDMSGIEVADILRTRHRIPVVYLTSHADPDTLARAGRTEPFGFIVKPFQEHDLHATIEMAFHRSRAEMRLYKLERWLSTTLDSIGDGVIATDLAGRVTYINYAAEQLTGWPRGEAIDHALNEVFAIKGDVPDGTSPSLVIKATEGESIRSTTARPLLHARDGRERPIDFSASPIREGAGNVVGVVIAFRDRTEHEKLLEEQRRMERRLLETQKLESLGVLAGGIAHDFNNLLTGIMGNTSLALSVLPEDSEAREYLADVDLASRRAGDLIRQMLAYSGRGRFVVEPVDLGSVVRETAKLLALSVNRKAELRLNLATDLPRVPADAAQIRQVVMNLVMNASEALSSGLGTIEVTTALRRVDRTLLDQAIGGEGPPEGDYVMLEVRDNGDGITPENLKRIFDPFFTTKFTGRGLGLAAVLGIVRGHHGALTVESEVGRGTTFRMYLPRIPGTAAAAEPPARSTTLTRGSGRILVIDDEPTVCSAATNILRARGFDVDAADDPIEGLETFTRDPGRYRAVLLDLTMPRMDGLEVFTALRRASPDLRIVLMSGYSEHEATQKFSNRGLAGFLQKPFDAAGLLGALNEALA